MTDLAPIIEQFRSFVTHSVPPPMLERTVAISIVLLVLGIGVSVLGAKLARPGLTALIGLLGGLGGVLFAQKAGFNAVIGGLVGAGMFATVALLTFRIWVGVATAVVASALALGAFGYHRVAPLAPEFEGMVASSPATEGARFTIPSPADQQAYRDRTPRQWADEFWTFATGKDAALELNSWLVGLGALAGGLFLGVIAMRWMLILSTSVFGTALVASSVATLIAHCVPESYQAFPKHPAIVGMGVGAFLVTSLILQTLLTRKAPAKGESNGTS